jgi:hypothetical protein
VDAHPPEEKAKEKRETMEGNKNIDLLMVPVLKAIKRHIKDRDAVTEIYNRAYEACLQAQESKNEPHVNEEHLKSIIRGMLPLWIAAMGYAEHGKAKQLDFIRNYYNSGCTMTQEEIHTMFSV